MKKGKLTAKQAETFEVISFAIGDGREHPIEDIKGVTVRKDEIPEYMAIFVEKGLYIFDGNKFIISGIGNDVFKKMKKESERAAQPVTFKYPKEFKAPKPFSKKDVEQYQNI